MQEREDVCIAGETRHGNADKPSQYLDYIYEKVVKILVWLPGVWAQA